MQTPTDERFVGLYVKVISFLWWVMGSNINALFSSKVTLYNSCVVFFLLFGDISIFSFLCAPLAGLKWAGLGWKNLMWPTSGNQSGFSKNLSKIWCWLVIKSDQTTATHSWWSSFSVKLSSNNTSTCFCYFKNWVGDSGKRQLIVESCSQIIKYQWAENDTVIN